MTSRCHVCGQPDDARQLSSGCCRSRRAATDPGVLSEQLVRLAAETQAYGWVAQHQPEGTLTYLPVHPTLAPTVGFDQATAAFFEEATPSAVAVLASHFQHLQREHATLVRQVHRCKEIVGLAGLEERCRFCAEPWPCQAIRSAPPVEGL